MRLSVPEILDHEFLTAATGYFSIPSHGQASFALPRIAFDTAVSSVSAVSAAGTTSTGALDVSLIDVPRLRTFPVDDASLPTAQSAAADVTARSLSADAALRHASPAPAHQSSLASAALHDASAAPLATSFSSTVSTSEHHSTRAPAAHHIPAASLPDRALDFSVLSAVNAPLRLHTSLAADASSAPQAAPARATAADAPVPRSAPPPLEPLSTARLAPIHHATPHASVREFQ